MLTACKQRIALPAVLFFIYFKSTSLSFMFSAEFCFNLFVFGRVDFKYSGEMNSCTKNICMWLLSGMLMKPKIKTHCCQVSF